MPIIDSHAHVWTNHSAFPWAVETVDPPQYDAHPEALLKLMQAESVESTVLVQYIGYRWDNSYLAHILRAFPEKFMGVCRVDPEDPSAPEHLSHWTEVHGFRGVRLSPEPDARGDWFRGPLMRPLFKRAAELNIPVLILTKPARLPDLVDILEGVPNVDVVIDHIADCKESNALHRQFLLALSHYPRAFLKTGHVWANSTMRYPWHDQHTLMKYVCELFGADRIMWGSDFPFCLQRATYAQALCYLKDEMHFLSQEELAWVLGGTTLRLWPFPQLVAPEDN
jgi:L-fuconolactonase